MLAKNWVWCPMIGFGRQGLVGCSGQGFCVWWPKIEFCGQGLCLMVKDWIGVAKDRIWRSRIVYWWPRIGKGMSSMVKRRCFGKKNHKKNHNILFCYAFLLKECELKRMAGWPGDPVRPIMCYGQRTPAGSEEVVLPDNL